MHNKLIRVLQFVAIGLLISTASYGDEGEIEKPDDWLPAHCVPLETIGFHDEAESTEEPREEFEIARFSSTPFFLRQNETFMELLGEVDERLLYLTLEPEEEAEFFELTCRPVMGANREPGFSCTNTPPSDLLLINPKSMRFSRSAIGSWTFQSQGDLDRGSSLFVQMGQCYSLVSDSS